jgi:uncharacterized protein
MPRIIHFEIHCDNTSRAAEFYSGIFGWQFTKFPGPQEYWFVNTGDSAEPGINGGLIPRKHPGGRVYNTIDVANLDETIKKIETNGGAIVVPKMLIPGVGHLAYFKDTEGNIHGVSEALRV